MLGFLDEDSPTPETKTKPGGQGDFPGPVEPKWKSMDGVKEVKAWLEKNEIDGRPFQDVKQVFENICRKPTKPKLEKLDAQTKVLLTWKTRKFDKKCPKNQASNALNEYIVDMIAYSNQLVKGDEAPQPPKEEKKKPEKQAAPAQPKSKHKGGANIMGGMFDEAEEDYTPPQKEQEPTTTTTTQEEVEEEEQPKPKKKEEKTLPSGSGKKKKGGADMFSGMFGEDGDPDDSPFPPPQEEPKSKKKEQPKKEKQQQPSPAKKPQPNAGGGGKKNKGGDALFSDMFSEDSVAETVSAPQPAISAEIREIDDTEEETAPKIKEKVFEDTDPATFGKTWKHQSGADEVKEWATSYNMGIYLGPFNQAINTLETKLRKNNLKAADEFQSTLIPEWNKFWLKLEQKRKKGFSAYKAAEQLSGYVEYLVDEAKKHVIRNKGPGEVQAAMKKIKITTKNPQSKQQKTEEVSGAEYAQRVEKNVRPDRSVLPDSVDGYRNEREPELAALKTWRNKLEATENLGKKYPGAVEEEVAKLGVARIMNLLEEEIAEMKEVEIRQFQTEIQACFDKIGRSIPLCLHLQDVERYLERPRNTRNGIKDRALCRAEELTGFIIETRTIEAGKQMFDEKVERVNLFLGNYMSASMADAAQDLIQASTLGVRHAKEGQVGWKYDDEQKSFEIYYHIDQLAVLTHRTNISEWGLQWTLDSKCAIAVQTQKAQNKLKQLNKEMVDGDILLNADWSFVEHKQFDPATLMLHLHDLVWELVPRVLGDGGLKLVQKHPVALQAVQQRVTTIMFQFIPDEEQENFALNLEKRNIKEDEHSKTLIVYWTVQSFTNQLAFSYKDNMYSAMLLLVLAAQYDGEQQRQEAEQLLGNGCKIEVIWNDENKPFMYADNITKRDQEVSGRLIPMLYEKLLPKAVDGLKQLLTSPPAVTQYEKLVTKNRLIFRVLPKLTQTYFDAQTDLTLEDGSLVLCVGLDTLEDAALCDDPPTEWPENNFVPRWSCVLHAIEPIACYCTRGTWSNIVAEVRSALKVGEEYPITVDWDMFVSNENYCNLPPTTRESISKAIRTSLAEKTLLGDDGITGRCGLCEFDEVGKTVVSKIKGISLSLDGDRKGSSKLTLDDGILQISYGIDSSDGGKGCHFQIEQLLQLRGQKELEACKRADKKIDAISAKIGVKVSVDWYNVRKLSEFHLLHSHAYVTRINNLASACAQMMTEAGNYWGSRSLLEIMENSSDFRRAVQGLKSILVQFPANAGTHYGASRGLVSSVFTITRDNDQLVVQCPFKETQPGGCGRAASFVLAESEAFQKEKAHMDNIHANQRAEHIRSQESARHSWESKCRDIDNHNKSEQDNYKRGMDEYNRNLTLSCNYSTCKSGRKKCGCCQGTGSETNNKITRTCHSCHGAGSFQCDQCKGTNKRYPNGPPMPSQPRIQQHPPPPPNDPWCPSVL